ncbi:MAG: hypothetical protein RIG63_31500 [Coleofasciculus chthonoplastes F3-SA18-01]|uniref:hypothetical protein n=1 Tax=Coleofasciculus chthonoplastes TaxID=64178 RepID=UPI0032F71D70
MEFNRKQPTPNLDNLPPERSTHWTTARLKILEWLQEQAPPLAELYEGAVCLVFEQPIPGKLRFVAHAVREIRNRLPDYISSGNGHKRLEYRKEVERLLEIWQGCGFSLEQTVPDSQMNTSGNLPPLSPDILVPQKLFLTIQQLLQKHREVRLSNREKAIPVFERCIPAEQSSPETFRPIAKHWWDVTEWFMAQTHDKGKVETGEAKRNEQELQSQFELFESFLIECARAQSFYSTTDKLDEILEDTNSTPEQVDQAVALLIHPQQRNYFFNRLENPNWIEPLQKKGFFKNLLASESRYLARMAKYEPDAVLNIGLNIEADNFRICEDFVEAALQMPPEIAVKLVPKVKEWLESLNSSDYYLDSKQVGSLVVHLAKGNEVKQALGLAKSLLAVINPNLNNQDAGTTQRYYRAEPKTRISRWQYKQILEKYVPELVTVASEKVLDKLLGSLLSDAVEFSLPSGTREANKNNHYFWEDKSIYWQPVIEEHPRNSPDEVRQFLAIAVRDAADTILQSDSSKLHSIVELLEKYHWRVFYRIALYLIRKFPDADRNLLIEKLVNQKRFSDRTVWEDYEYVYLAKDYFGDLPKEEQDKILSWIENPDLDWTLLENPEEKAKRLRSWQLHKLTPLKDSLPTQWEQRYQQLVQEFGTVELSKIVFGGIDEVRILGTQSPKTESELDSMSIEELISFLKTWKPNSNHPFDEPSYAGLESVVRGLAEKNTEKYARLAENFQNLHPRYGYSLLCGLESALINQHDKLREFPWLSVLRLCYGLVEESHQAGDQEKIDHEFDHYWRTANQEVTDLLRVGFTDQQKQQIPFNLRSDVWNILKRLTQDPNPTPEDEAHNDSSNRDFTTLSLNTVRGAAMHTVVRYALWIRQHFEQMPDSAERIAQGFNEMPEVRQILDEHLDPDYDPSQAIRSVYGQWFPWLVLLDSDWASQNVSKIFPADQALSDLWDSAWESYITYCAVYDNAFDVLHQEYSNAIAKIDTAKNHKEQLSHPEEGFAQHLMTLYWRGTINLNEPEGLLAQFYAKAPDSLCGYALEFVGRSLHQTKEAIEPDILNRIQLLWQQRLETARTEPASHTNELAAFGWWFNSGKFDETWAIEQLAEVLKLGVQVEEFLVSKRLATLAPKMPQSVIECLSLMIETAKNAWHIYGYRKEAKIILSAAIESSNDQAKKTAVALINRLGELGHWEFRELFPVEG